MNLYERLVADAKAYLKSKGPKGPLPYGRTTLDRLTPKDRKFWDTWFRVYRLTQNPNIHEAESALCKSREMLEDHVPRFTMRDIPDYYRNRLKRQGHKRSVEKGALDKGRRWKQGEPLPVIVQALKNLGRPSRPLDIYAEFRRISSLRTTSHNIRRQMQYYSSDSKQWEKGRPDLFANPRRGVWTLRPESDSPKRPSRPVVPEQTAPVLENLATSFQ